MLIGLGLLAAALGVVAYVRYRSRETVSLGRDVDLARSLRELAGDDEVRLAAVDEFELAVYQRLFYASVIGPRLRSAAWSLLGAVLTAGGVLATAGGDGIASTTIHVATAVLAVVFTAATVWFAGLAVYHTATTPRVSFAESYADDD